MKSCILNSVFLAVSFLLVSCNPNKNDMTVTGFFPEIVKNGSILTIYGKNINTTPGACKVYLAGKQNSYTFNPFFVSKDSIKVELFNQDVPFQPIVLGGYKPGIMMEDMIIFNRDSVSVSTSWTNVSDFPGDARYKSSCFSIGGKCYIGGGAAPGFVYKDLWVYNPNTNSWTRLADLPGAARVYPRAFANSTHGYMGAGTSADNSSRVQLYDFYKYDPVANSWTQIPDYPDLISGFYTGNSVTTDGRPFALLSNSGVNMRELVGDAWISRNAIPEMTDCPASGIFTVGKKFYVVAGFKTNNTASNSVWEYDPETETWTRKSNFPGLVRYAPAFFAIGNYCYYGCGMTTNQTQLKDMWRYDPSSDQWIRLEDFPGGYRSHLISTEDGNSGFIGLGLMYSPVTFFKDFWRFDPD
jgi:N-acetylneuraminic acid mutarotase